MRDFTRIAKARRTFLHAELGLSHPSILEIGAFDNPTFHPDAGDHVSYLDFFSGPELRELHKGNGHRHFDAIVDVDYVVKDRAFGSAVGKQFDLIVANHVIEHVPDVIFWFEQIGRLLRPGGKLFLAIPDRRYTFDYFRPESLATQMLRAYENKLERPDKWHLVEHFYYHQKVDLEQIWAGSPPKSFNPRFSLARARSMAEKQSKVYTDAHCWVFTPESFMQCVTDLQSAEITRLAIGKIEATRKGAHEFWALLNSM